MRAAASEADAGIGTSRANDTKKRHADGKEALGGGDDVRVVRSSSSSADGVVDITKQKIGMGDDDDADEGDESSGKLCAGEDLTEEDVAGPCGDEGDEEAEDGGFGQGEVMDGV